MERKPFESVSVEELWQLHTIVNDILAVRLVVKRKSWNDGLGCLAEKTSPPQIKPEPVWYGDLPLEGPCSRGMGRPPVVLRHLKQR